jgi:hypothetical protein
LAYTVGGGGVTEGLKIALTRRHELLMRLNFAGLL